MTSAPQSGLYRLNARDLPALKAASFELGRAFLSVDLLKARNVPSLLRAFQKSLAFPAALSEGCGRLDALRAGLIDLSWYPASGYVLVLTGFAPLSAQLTSFAALNEVLASAARAWQARSIPFCVFFVEDEVPRPPTT